MKYLLHTIEKTEGEITAKITQKLLPDKYTKGHYDWVIMDKNGNILTSGFSTWNAHNKKTEIDLDEKIKDFKRWEDEDEYI